MAESLRLPSEQQARIEPLLTTKKRRMLMDDDRRTLSKIVRSRKCGGRFAPPVHEYRSKTTLYCRVRRWAICGMVEGAFAQASKVDGIPHRLLISSCIMNNRSASALAMKELSASPHLRTELRGSATCPSQPGAADPSLFAPTDNGLWRGGRGGGGGFSHRKKSATETAGRKLLLSQL